MSNAWQRRAAALITVLLVWSLFDAGPSIHSPSNEIQNAIKKENHDWHVLNTTKFRDFDPENQKWLNLTGLRQEDNWAWTALPDVKRRAKDILLNTLGYATRESVVLDEILSSSSQVYQNVSGYVAGKWVRSTIDQIILRPDLFRSQAGNETDISDFKSYHKNITGLEGNINIEFEERGDADEWQSLNARGVRAKLSISTTGSSDDHPISLHGMHLLEIGSLVLVSHSSRFPGLFALPHFALTENHYNAFQHRLNRTLKNIIKLQETYQYEIADPWSSDVPQSSVPTCEFVIYLQQYPLSQYNDVAAIEKELRFPSGANLPRAPKMHMSMVLFSPDCGFALESMRSNDGISKIYDHLGGYKTESFFRMAKEHLIGFGMIMLLQIMTMIRQTREACTPSTRNRISVYSIIILTLGDGLTCLLLFPSATFVDLSFITIMAVSAIALLQVLAFDGKVVIDIWEVQQEDNARRRRQQASDSGRTTPFPVISAASVDVLPLPVTAGPGRDVEIIGSDGQVMTEGRAREGMNSHEIRLMIYRSLVFAIIALFIFTLMASTLPPLWRHIYFDMITFIYISCWIPQIYRNSIRNCRKALGWDFVVGQTCLRLIPLLYLYGYEHNLANIAPNLYRVAFICGWSWLQICVLATQAVFGPRLLVPKSWVPPAYDYHPVLKEDDENSHIILGFSSSSSLSKGKDKRLFDCAICMQAVEIPIISRASNTRGEGLGGSAFIWKQNYMITPCRHVFHSKCLEAAMRFRLQCPICRDGLPPL